MNSIDTTAILQSDFDFATHSKSFHNYCEVVILEDGKIEYAVPSHDQKLLSVVAKKYATTIPMLVHKFEGEAQAWYWEICSYNTRCMQVTNEYAKFFFMPTQRQLAAASLLVKTGCCDSQLLESIHQGIRYYKKATANLKEHSPEILTMIKTFFKKERDMDYKKLLQKRHYRRSKFLSNKKRVAYVKEHVRTIAVVYFEKNEPVDFKVDMKYSSNNRKFADEDKNDLAFLRNEILTIFPELRK